MSENKEAKLSELCEQALKDYKEMSDKVCSFNSLIPQAISFYAIYFEKFESLQQENARLREDIAWYRWYFMQANQTLEGGAKC